MARKDFYHNTVRNALLKDGWTITHEPINLSFLNTRLEIDLGAERLEVVRGTVKIAVEVKNFREESTPVNEFHKSIGQVLNYMDILSRKEPSRTVYLAVSKQAYATVFSNPLVKNFVSRLSIKLVVFNTITETITKWDA